MFIQTKTIDNQTILIDTSSISYVIRDYDTQVVIVMNNGHQINVLESYPKIKSVLTEQDYLVVMKGAD